MPKKINFRKLIPPKGELVHHKWILYEHPTGHAEFIPLIILRGINDGPCLWLTAGIHGDEHAGPAALYHFLSEVTPREINGTVILVPGLNPPGLRTMRRNPYRFDKDPNRMWPEPRPPKQPDMDDNPPNPLEIAYRKLLEIMIEFGDALIDYHAAWTGSLSFAFQDRIPYRSDQNMDVNLRQAEKLAEKQLELLKAYNHTIIREMSVDKLFEKNLHKTTSAAFMYLGKKPAFTVELGTGEVPDLSIVNAAVKGTRNVMRTLGMLDGDFETISEIKVIDLGYPVRRCSTPRVTKPCVVLHKVKAGEQISKGQKVAELRDIFGEKLSDGDLLSTYDGFVIGREHGIYFYPGEAVCAMAVRDDIPLIAPFPKGYFADEEKPIKEE